MVGHRPVASWDPYVCCDALVASIQGLIWPVMARPLTLAYLLCRLTHRHLYPHEVLYPPVNRDWTTGPRSHRSAACNR